MGSICNCSCQEVPTLILTCSGASDTGDIADRASRELSRQGIGKMLCLAGISAHVSGMVKSIESAEMLLAIDGCPLNCAKKTLEAAGRSDLKHLCLADIGLKKGSSEPSSENINLVVDQAKQLIMSYWNNKETKC